jgi:hypothetical protein
MSGSGRSTNVWRLVIACSTAILISGCVSLPGAVAEQHPVRSVSDPSRVVVFNEPMVWLDAPTHRASKGVRLQPGEYALEAENDEYWYFRAPEPLELRALDGSRTVDGRFVPGGLALSKGFNLVPAAVYIDGDVAGQKLHVMRMGRDFLQLRGKTWEPSFSNSPLW